MSYINNTTNIVHLINFDLKVNAAYNYQIDCLTGRKSFDQLSA